MTEQNPLWTDDAPTNSYKLCEDCQVSVHRLHLVDGLCPYCQE